MVKIVIAKQILLLFCYAQDYCEFEEKYSCHMIKKRQLHQSEICPNSETFIDK